MTTLDMTQALAQLRALPNPTVQQIKDIVAQVDSTLSTDKPLYSSQSFMF